MQVTSQFRTVALVGRSNTPGIGEPLTALASCIAKRGFDVVFEAETAAEIGVTGYPGMAELRVSVDGRFMYNQRSDGLIVATPTGSTAYALSSSGPILHPQLQGIVLVPIAPHALSNRPIVLPDDCKVSIQIVSGRDVNVNFDMQSFTALELNDTIDVRRSRHTVPFLHPVGYSYYATLRKKLHWNEYPSLDDPPA